MGNLNGQEAACPKQGSFHQKHTEFYLCGFVPAIGDADYSPLVLSRKIEYPFD
jgi:hypothetical protein